MSINIPWITEMYANFGRAGIILGMTLCGMVFGLLDRFLNAPGAGITGTAISAGVLLPLFYQESNLTLMTGSLVPQFVSFWLFFFIMQRIAALGQKAAQ